MASIFHGYEYDIFISYRQKDNRSDQWVTNFVQALREELDATFKEEISIYFDSNPHDGLLETHDVDGSLKDKIKCLVFIPIVSQTYCDPKSFAWQKEFLAFLGYVKTDELGLDIKLVSGNVSKRVLPVRIHEIDDTDKKLFEDAIGGVMRPVDFIYKEPGVNRPLTAADNRNENLNHTNYKNQINKVANAINELLRSIVKKPGISALADQLIIPEKGNSILQKSIIALLVVFLSGFGFYYLYSSKAPDERNLQPEAITIAILPFKSLSPDPKEQFLSDGFYEEIIDLLSTQNELSIISKTSSDYVAHAGLSSQEIAEKLNVRYILSGSLRKDGQSLRIITRLEEAASGKLVAVRTYDGKLEDYFSLQREIALRISGEIGIVLSKGLTFPKTTDNLKAWEFFMMSKRSSNPIEYLDSALRYDPLFIQAWSNLSAYCFSRFSFNHDSVYLKKGMHAKNVIEGLDKNGYFHRMVEISYYYWIVNDFNLVISKCDESLKSYPFATFFHMRKGTAYRRMGMFQEFAISMLHGLKHDPMNPGTIDQLAISLESYGETALARELIKRLENPANQSSLYFSHLLTIALIENNQPLLDSLLISIRHAEFEDKPKIMSAVEWAKQVTRAFAQKNYAQLVTATMWHDSIGHFDWDDDLNPAFIYWVMNDTANSRPLFKKVRDQTYADWPGSDLGKSFAKYVRAMCDAALGEPDWESAFSEKIGIPNFMPDYYRTYTLSCLLAGDKTQALKILRQWKESNAGNLAHASGPHQALNLLFKYHPILDRIRQEPEFDELWKGNLLQMKSLNFSAELISNE